MKITGSYRIWKKGGNFNNQFLQMYLIIDGKRFAFSGYVDEKDMSQVNILLAAHWGNLKVTKDLKNDRKSEHDEYVDWCYARELHLSTYIVPFLMQIKYIK